MAIRWADKQHRLRSSFATKGGRLCGGAVQLWHQSVWWKWAHFHKSCPPYGSCVFSEKRKTYVHLLHCVYALLVLAKCFLQSPSRALAHRDKRPHYFLDCLVPCDSSLQSSWPTCWCFAISPDSEFVLCSYSLQHSLSFDYWDMSEISRIKCGFLRIFAEFLSVSSLTCEHPSNWNTISADERHWFDEVGMLDWCSIIAT